MHGGLTYAAECDGDDICHTPEPGEPEHMWWVGFDCAHGFDCVPVLHKLSDSVGPTDHYRTVDYVTKELEEMYVLARAAPALDIVHAVEGLAITLDEDPA